MEIRPITKVERDGTRLFVELSKNMRDPNGLPDLKKGDNILLLPQRHFTKDDMIQLEGKRVGFIAIDKEEIDSDLMEGIFPDEGVIKRNNPEWYTDEDDPDKKKNYVLWDDEGEIEDKLDAEDANEKYEPYPEEYVLATFDNLDEFFDVKLLPPVPQYHRCSGKKCNKSISEEDNYCSNCGEPNRMKKRGDKKKKT